MFQCAEVNLFRKIEAFAIAFGKTDEFFEPGCAGGLDMQSRPEPRQRSLYRTINGKLIAAGMDAELQCCWQSIAFDGESDYSEIFVELLFKLRHIAGIVDTLVEAAGEFRRNGLQRNTFIRKNRENHQQFRRRLRSISFIHRDFSDEIPCAFNLC